MKKLLFIIFTFISINSYADSVNDIGKYDKTKVNLWGHSIMDTLKQRIKSPLDTPYCAEDSECVDVITMADERLLDEDNMSLRIGMFTDAIIKETYSEFLEKLEKESSRTGRAIHHDTDTYDRCTCDISWLDRGKLEADSCKEESAKIKLGRYVQYEGRKVISMTRPVGADCWWPDDLEEWWIEFCQCETKDDEWGSSIFFRIDNKKTNRSNEIYMMVDTESDSYEVSNKYRTESGFLHETFAQIAAIEEDFDAVVKHRRDEENNTYCHYERINGKQKKNCDQYQYYIPDSMVYSESIYAMEESNKITTIKNLDKNKTEPRKIRQLRKGKKKS